MADRLPVDRTGAPGRESLRELLWTAVLAALLAFPPWLGAAEQLRTAQWPAKLFVPYAFIPYEDAASSCLRETGQKYYTLAFVISDPQGQPAWDGQKNLRVQGGFFAPAIQAIRSVGGDVIVSFGGAGGQELALVTPDPALLAAKYRAVVEHYQLSWLDFDIEGSTLTNQRVNERRNDALRQLQVTNPGLRITFTLPCNPTGLEDDALHLLADARKQGVNIASVNAMTMDYAREVKAGATMGDLAIAAVTAAHGQLRKLGLDCKLGITPMIGENDVKAVVFEPFDARKVSDFARRTDWIGSVSFWSVNRDQGPEAAPESSGVAQARWEFTNIFKPLTD